MKINGKFKNDLVSCFYVFFRKKTFFSKSAKKCQKLEKIVQKFHNLSVKTVKKWIRKRKKWRKNRKECQKMSSKKFFNLQIKSVKKEVPKETKNEIGVGVWFFLHLLLWRSFGFFVNKNVKKVNKNMTSDFYFIIENSQKKDQKIKFR